MNPHDKENLDFLLNSSRETIALWFKQADFDDIEYATELLAIATLEASMLVEHEDMSDLTLANLVLSKFRI
jgi:hypothetical protein